MYIVYNDTGKHNRFLASFIGLIPVVVLNEKDAHKFYSQYGARNVRIKMNRISKGWKHKVVD